MKKAILFFLLIFSAGGFAQSLNSYKYVIVPERYGFQDNANQYNLNWLSKSMFEKYGFVVYYNNDILPADLASNRCLALFADLEDSGFMRTVLVIKLRDCQNNLVFTSGEGSSKIKDRNQGYPDALRKASKDLDKLNYQYSGKDIRNTAANQQTSPVSSYDNGEVLTAQAISNGYQLMDASSKVMLKMYRTSQPDSYTAQSDTKNGVVFKKGNDWIFEYYQNEKMVSEKLNIRF
ncbi:MAG: hypothetical protein EOO45_21480 [Flavobacterium sp.]|nr:MAG: hypothetical protein EOO45_21480 [Flavobacterium sp.]